MNWLKTFKAGGGYGLSLENPVRCGGGPAGERKYLSKLRCPNGQKVADIATSALGKIGEAALPVIGDLLKSDNANVRIAAVCAVLPCGKSALPLLVEARAKEKDPLVFVGLQNTIAKIGEEK